MKSKVFVEYDFDSNEPYLQLSIDDTVALNERPDLRDVALRNFSQTASGSLLYLTHNYNAVNNDYPQLRVLTAYKTPEPIMQGVITHFELFAKQFFNDSEIGDIDIFFNALRVKCSLKAPIK